eukprot:4670216-Pleurochrysis_carterae.AAC.1
MHRTEQKIVTLAQKIVTLARLRTDLRAGDECIQLPAQQCINLLCAQGTQLHEQQRAHTRSYAFAHMCMRARKYLFTLLAHSFAGRDAHSRQGAFMGTH